MMLLLSSYAKKLVLGVECILELASADTSGSLRIPYLVHIRYGYAWDTPGICIWAYYF
jgi:hypothetical protein